jgi:hypothetical protein
MGDEGWRVVVLARSERFELPTLGIEILGAIKQIKGLATRCCNGVAVRRQAA